MQTILSEDVRVGMKCGGKAMQEDLQSNVQCMLTDITELMSTMAKKCYREWSVMMMQWWVKNDSQVMQYFVSLKNFKLTLEGMESYGTFVSKSMSSSKLMSLPNVLGCGDEAICRWGMSLSRVLFLENLVYFGKCTMYMRKKMSIL